MASIFYSNFASAGKGKGNDVKVWVSQAGGGGWGSGGGYGGGHGGGKYGHGGELGVNYSKTVICNDDKHVNLF